MSDYNTRLETREKAVMNERRLGSLAIKFTNDLKPNYLKKSFTAKTKAIAKVQANHILIRNHKAGSYRSNGLIPLEWKVWKEVPKMHYQRLHLGNLTNISNNIV